jgi:hypothetical protein
LGAAGQAGGGSGWRRRAGLRLNTAIQPDEIGLVRSFMIVRGIRPETGRSVLMIMKVRRTDREQRPARMIVRGIRLETGRIPLTITDNQPRPPAYPGVLPTLACLTRARPH